MKTQARSNVRALFERVNQQLEGKQWLAGFRSYADPYLYVTLRWADNCGIDMNSFDNLAAFKQRMEADSGVQAALKTEGMV